MDSAESDFTDFTIGIVGLGLIGGSYAKALKRLGIKRIIGVDIDPHAVEQALMGQSIDTGLCNGDPVLKTADMLIFCLPVQAMIRFIRDNAENFNPQAILTDVAGIKGNTARIIQSLLGREMDFVPGHPMAGREGNGFLQSDAAIFKNANYILVPQECNLPEHVESVRHLARALGCSNIITVTPEEHDRMIAYTSDLPHVLATALINSCSMNKQTKYFIAGGFRDGTRVADINASLWTQLFISNKGNLLEEIKRFRDSLQDFTDFLTNNEEEKMEQYLQKAAVRRRELY